MKYLRQLTHHWPQFIAGLILTSILFLGVGFAFFRNVTVNNVAADPIETSIDAKNGNLPESVANSVLEDASTRYNLPVEELRLVQAEPQDWPDGCLGLAPPDTFCTQIIVSGWQVTVEGGGKSLVYRTDDSGSLVKLEQN